MWTQLYFYLPNKHVGWKMGQNLKNMQGQINMQGGKMPTGTCQGYLKCGQQQSDQIQFFFYVRFGPNLDSGENFSSLAWEIARRAFSNTLFLIWPLCTVFYLISPQKIIRFWWNLVWEYLWTMYTFNVDLSLLDEKGI